MSWGDGKVIPSGAGQLFVVGAGNSATNIDTSPHYPAPPAREAYHGLAGRIVHIFEPVTEADPVAILAQLLIGFGNIIGRTAHAVVENTTHYLNIFAALVGVSSKSRKGTSWAPVRKVFQILDEGWVQTRIEHGLGSGEALVNLVRDPIEKQTAIKEKGKVVGYQTVIEDPGIEDKRLLILQPEMASTLKVILARAAPSATY